MPLAFVFGKTGIARREFAALEEGIFMARIQSLTTIPSVSNTDVLAIEHNTGTGTYKVPISMLLSDVYSKSEAVAKADIVNNLTGTATDKPLSAAQGKVLNDMMPKSATISVDVNTAGIIPFTGITATHIVSATSNGYIILTGKTGTGAWRGLVTDLALNIVTSQPTLSVNVLYY